MSAAKSQKTPIPQSSAEETADLPFFAVVGRLYDEEDAAFVVQAKTKKQAVSEAKKRAGATKSSGPGSFILGAVFDCGDHRPTIL